MRARGLAGCVLAWAALLGCGPDPDVGGGLSRSPIIFGGACGPEDEAAGALLFDGQINFPLGSVEGPTVLCSAVLVAPDVALTAAHCVDLAGIGATGARVDARAVSFDADLRAVYDEGAAFPVGAIPVRGDLVAPGFDAEAYLAADGLGQQHDWALLFLDEVAPRAPYPVLAPDQAPVAVGSGVDLVGHGTTDPNGAVPGEQTTGQRRCAFSFVNLLGEHELQIGAGDQTVRRCEVDSGGPTFVEREGQRVVASIGSRAFAFDCSAGAVDTRLDAAFDEIDAALRDACDQGLRVDCAQPGLRTARPVDAGPDDAGADDGAVDGGLVDSGDPPADAGPDGGLVDAGAGAPPPVGCACDARGEAAPPATGALLGALYLFFRRRQARSARAPKP